MGVCDVVRLLWSKVDAYDLVHSRYFTIWPRFGTGYLRFGPIYSDLVIRVTRVCVWSCITNYWLLEHILSSFKYLDCVTYGVNSVHFISVL